MDVQSSSSYRIRSILQQLRPYFLEVLATPNFRDCKAGHEIHKHMELLVHLYKQMVLETNKPAGRVMLENSNLSRKIMATKEDQKRKMEKLLLQPRRRRKKSMESGPAKISLSSGKKLNMVSRIEGSYIVGGSVSGLNFITYGSSKPEYYGVKKESFRSSHN